MIIAVDFDGTCVTHVIYDGSIGRADKVKSMYRYGK